MVLAKKRLGVLVVTAVLGLAQLALAGEIIVFGDSFSDGGNSVTGAFGYLLDPKIYTAGRISNSFVWVDYLAQNAGQPLEASRNGGTNYAWAGAPVSSSATGDDFGSVIQLTWLLRNLNILMPIDCQIAEYRFWDQRLPAADDLIVLSGGANDLVDTANGCQPSGVDPRYVARRQGELIRFLISQGARHFLIVNLGPIDKTPCGLRTPVSNRRALRVMKNRFNRELLKEVRAIRRESDVRIDFLNLDQLAGRVLRRPRGYGITNVTDVAYDGTSVVPNVEQYAFFDEVHLTSTVHRIVGLEAYNLIQ